MVFANVIKLSLASKYNYINYIINSKMSYSLTQNVRLL